MLRLTIALLLIAAPAWAIHTRLGVLHTQEEVTEWKDRWSNGPYETQGDVSTNSPGDKDRILTNADAFDASPTDERWSGWNGETGCMDGTVANPGPGRHVELKDAAFTWLMTGTASYLTDVTNELLHHAALAEMDFTDGTLWCADGSAIVLQPIFDGAHWMLKLAVGYSFIRNDISAANKTTLDAWFTGMMEHFEARVNKGFDTGEAWPFYDDRLNGDWTLTSTGNTQFNDPVTVTGSESATTHLNGNSVTTGQQTYNNRLSTLATLFGFLAVMFDDADAINSFKSYVKEMLQFVTYSDGTYYEFNRWNSSNPSLGWSYASNHLMGNIGIVIAALARTGDFDLLNFSTANGEGGDNGTTDTSGGSKTVKGWYDHQMSYVDESTTVRYGTGNESNQNSTYQIKTVDGLTGETRVADICASALNLYWRDTTINAAYMREVAGAPDYPANPSGPGARNWGCVQGILPGTMIMFGDLEGVLYPFPSRQKVW